MTSRALVPYTIRPILGLKTNVPEDSPSLFVPIGDAEAATYCVGPSANFDIYRNPEACTKAYGFIQWSNTATAQATKCLGLFELYDGTNLNHIFIDNGKFYKYDASRDPGVIEDAGTTTFANDDIDLYSMIRVGPWVVFTDRGEHEPQIWKHGEATLANLIASGTAYKFRYLESFQRRVIGCYSDQTDGDIDLRYSTSWPGTAITSLNFPAANQLYIPNDDPITGVRRMGRDRCFIYSRDSIHSLDYLQDYETPFRLRNVVDGQGCSGHHSVVNLADRHYLFNRHYGFCEFRGGEFPFGGRPISEDIDDVLESMITDYYPQIVGAFIPGTREVVWTAPLYGATTPSHLLFYHIDKRMWRIEAKANRYVDHWALQDIITLQELIDFLGGASSTFTDAGLYNSLATYIQARNRLVYANSDGHLFYQGSESIDTTAYTGWRYEPMMHFGDPQRMDTLQEIWFSLQNVGEYDIEVYYRGGETPGETLAANYESLGRLSANSPDVPCIRLNKTHRMHQIWWGTLNSDEPFEVTSITFKYVPQSYY